MANVIFRSSEPVESESQPQWFNKQKVEGTDSEDHASIREKTVVEKRPLQRQQNADQQFEDEWKDFFKT